MKYEVIKKKSNKVNYGLISLIGLNLFDGIVTYIGLRRGVYIELNKVLSFIYESSLFMFIVVKLIVPTVILTILVLKLTYQVSKVTKMFICIANIVYFTIGIYHIMLILSIVIR